MVLTVDGLKSLFKNDDLYEHLKMLDKVQDLEQILQVQRAVIIGQYK